MKSGCDLCVCVYESMYQYVLACTYVYLVRLALSKNRYQYETFILVHTSIYSVVPIQLFSSRWSGFQMSDHHQWIRVRVTVH
jgi:hypothetical protein